MPIRDFLQTERIYEIARKDYEVATQTQASTASSEDVNLWVQSLLARGLRPATIRTYVAGVKRTSKNNICVNLPPNFRRPARIINTTEAHSILSNIATNTVRGAQDYALLLSLLLGMKVHYIRTLAWREIGKLPKPLQAAYTDLLQKIKNKPLPSDLIFVPITKSWINLLHHNHRFHEISSKSLSGTEITRKCKRYGQKAGLENITARILINSGKYFLKQTGGDYERVTKLIAQKNFNVGLSVWRNIRKR